MSILLLCDRESAGGMRGAAESILSRSGRAVETVECGREALLPCIGCFGCGVKTPGRCVITKDPANAIAAKIIRADAVVLLSRITYGGLSADVKAMLDRCAPQLFLLPGFAICKGEMRHPMRYPRWPVWIAAGYGDATDAERATFATLTLRNALNVHPDAYLAVTARDEAELFRNADAIVQTLEGAVA